MYGLWSHTCFWSTQEGWYAVPKRKDDKGEYMPNGDGINGRANN